MALEHVKKLIEDDQRLNVGDHVTVRWGYGLGFRVEGKGVITKIFEKSIRVRLEEDVKFGNESGWPEGFELKGIPRYWNGFNDKWDYWNSVELR